MASINHFQCIGWLTEDIEVRDLSSGMSVTDLNVQINSRFQKDDGSYGVGKTFVTVTVWGQSASFLGQYAHKGSQVFVSGRVETDSWEDDQGNKKYKTKVVADSFGGVHLLDPKTPLSGLSEESCLVAGGLNRVDLLGNITKEIEVKETPKGSKVANFSIATNRRWKDKNTGEMNEKSEFHNIVVWGELAEHVAQNITKGNLVYISGSLSTRSWETPTGEKRYTTEVNATQVISCGRPAKELSEGRGRSDSESVSSRQQKNSDSAPMVDIPRINYESDIKPEDLPF